jgi:transaldolase
MPEGVFKVYIQHRDIGNSMPADGGDCEELQAKLASAGIDFNSRATKHQEDEAKSFIKFWNELMAMITSKSTAPEKKIFEMIHIMNNLTIPLGLNKFFIN